MLQVGRAIILLLALIVCACAHEPRYQLPVSSIDSLLDGDEFMGAAGSLPRLVEPRELLSMNKQTTDFAKEYVENKVINLYQLERFSRLLFNEGMLGLEYQLDGNYSAQETFDKRRGNCLSVALLATALLREAGTRTYFQEADVAPTWGQLHDDNSVVVTRHMNVVARVGTRKMIIEFDRADTERGDYLDRRRISDDQAFAHYYNNLGVEYLAKEDYRRAFAYIRTAIELSSSDSHFWSNIGVLYRRSELLDKAEVAFLHAINLDSGNFSAMTNLVSLYQMQGNTIAAKEFSNRVENWRNQNPYYRYSQAKKAFQVKDFASAEHHIDYVIEVLGEDRSNEVAEFATRVREKLSQPQRK